MSLVLTGTDFVVAVFLLMGLNGIFCFQKIPIVAVPLGLFSWIFMFAFSISYTAINLIMVILMLLFASSAIVLNIQDFRK